METLEIESVNECIDVATLDSSMLDFEQNDFDSSCYNGDACNSSSG